MTINYERGDSIDAANLEVRGSTSGGPVGNGWNFVPGDTIQVTAVRGETVQVIWQAPDGSESAVLAQFVVRVPENA